MEGVRLFSHEEAEKYLSYVGRLGKAKALPADQREKCRHAYDDTVKYLRDNFESYLMYCVSDGDCIISESVFAAMSAHAEKEGICDRLKESLSAGNTDEFVFNCQALELIYMYYEHERQKHRKAMGVMRRVC